MTTTDTKLYLSNTAPAHIQSEIRAMSVECERVGGINMAQGRIDRGTPGVAVGPRTLDPLNPYATASIRGTGAGIAAAIRVQTPAQRRSGLGTRSSDSIVPGSANDPSSR